MRLNIIINIRPLLWTAAAVVLSAFVFLYLKRDLASSVLSGTAVLIGWYSWETFLLRGEMRRQNELNETPIVNLYLRSQQGYASDRFALRNVSGVSSYNITIQPIEIGGLSYRFQFDQANCILEPDGDEKPLRLFVRTPTGSIANTVENIKSYLAPKSFKNVEESGKRFAVFVIHYNNLSSKQFFSVFKFYSKHPLTEEFTIEFVGSGVGHISSEGATRLAAQLPKQETVYA